MMLPPAASASETVTDIARYWGVFGWIAPFAPSASGGITTNAAPFAPASLLGRIGSPTEIAVMVILPTTWFGSETAAGGTASEFMRTSLRSAVVICVFGGISRAATITAVGRMGAGASDFVVWA